MAEVSASALDLEALRSFVLVARLGTLAAAAEERHRTVSALSMQIKRLEAHLDARLLIRGARGMTTTPTGEAGIDLLASLAQGFERRTGDRTNRAGDGLIVQALGPITVGHAARDAVNHLFDQHDRAGEIHEHLVIEELGAPRNRLQSLAAVCQCLGRRCVTKRGEHPAHLFELV